MSMENENNSFAGYKDLIDNRLAEFLKEETKRSRYSGNKYPYSLYDPVNYIMSGGGKRIRPLMTMLSCEVFGGKAEDALDAAVAMEILHNFTLVHDDIMDNAETRRGRETVHKKWDVNSAILVGDELIGLSYRSLLRTNSDRIAEIIRAFTDGVIEVCEGQALDKEFEVSNDVSLNDYMLMICKKTAELLKTSAVVGAITGKADKSQIEIINTYSENLGLAFQIQDDLLDVTGNETEFGKKIGGDILEKKKTFLYIKSLEALSGDEKRSLMELYNKDEKTSEDINEVISVYNRICSIESAKNEIKKYTDRANQNLQGINSEKYRDRLKSFSNMLLNRNY